MDRKKVQSESEIKRIIRYDFLNLHFRILKRYISFH